MWLSDRVPSWAQGLPYRQYQLLSAQMTVGWVKLTVKTNQNNVENVFKTKECNHKK